MLKREETDRIDINISNITTNHRKMSRAAFVYMNASPFSIIDVNISSFFFTLSAKVSVL
jgi:hypothetical protein